MKLFLFFLLTSLLIATGIADEPTSPSVAEVEIFVSVDCPIANSYLPLLKRLDSEYKSQGVSFLLVYPEPDLSDSDVEKHREEYSIPIEGVLDPRHARVKRAGATITPEAVVYNSAGKLVYRGMIDNLYTDFGDRRKSATVHYLRDVLEAMIAGDKIPHPITAPVGCYIE